ncbi:hypothetical protein C1645_816059 [Glomus cerebriforme]|uniref:Uncharacterized protein n=1 Tax=Glomus cerebriforme TaxID=658196 RepID=A0A397TCJ6_9GLOM|nr:hypothetical protein C1645_816059 [Glomus cerebriforme]
MELKARLVIVEQNSLVVNDQLHKEQNNDDTKTLEEKEMDAFLVKEDFFMTSAELVTFLEQVVKELIPAYKSVTSGNKLSAGTSPVKSFMVDKQALTSENIETECQKIPYNQKIPELSLEAILIGFSEVTVQNIVNLFKVAMKLRCKRFYAGIVTIKHMRIELEMLNLKMIQDILNDFPKKATNMDDVGYENSILIWNRHVTSKTNKIEEQANLLGVNSLASVSSASQSKPNYDHTYFLNKTLNYYPNLYREFSSENFNYYGITDETSCLLCN